MSLGKPVRRASAALVVLLAMAALGAGLLAQDPAPLPTREELVRKVRDAVRLDYELQQEYTYIEKRRDVKLSKLGKVLVGPMRTFEVYPSSQPGRTYKRLIAIEGKPLPPDELARRDEEHRRNVMADAEAEKRATPAELATRARKAAAERRERDALINDAFAIFEATILGREVLDGQPVFAVALRPRPYVEPRTREGRWMKKFTGRLWVSDPEAQVAKIDMVAAEDLTIGLGLVGRVHKGSRLVFSRRKVNDEVWLPADSHITATGRTLLFRLFEVDMRSEYRDYKKWSVDTAITYSVPQE